MPASLEILDLPETGQLQLSILDENAERRDAPPVTFSYPLTDEELLEIAWLFTEFSR